MHQKLFYGILIITAEQGVKNKPRIKRKERFPLSAFFWRLLSLPDSPLQNLFFTRFIASVYVHFWLRSVSLFRGFEKLGRQLKYRVSCYNKNEPLYRNEKGSLDA